MFVNILSTHVLESSIYIEVLHYFYIGQTPKRLDINLISKRFGHYNFELSMISPFGVSLEASGSIVMAIVSHL